MQLTGQVKAVGKYKEQFKSTGLLLVLPDGETWVDIPGELDYREYKGNTVTVDAKQNAKGFWSGTLVTGSSQASSASAQRPNASQGGNESQESRNRGFAMSYAKDIVVCEAQGYENLFVTADRILDWLDNKPKDMHGRTEQQAKDYNDAPPVTEDDVPF